MYPDVSRIFYSGPKDFNKIFFNKRKYFQIDKFNMISNVQRLSNLEYDSLVKEIVRNAVDFPNLNNCFVDKTLKYPNTRK